MPNRPYLDLSGEIDQNEGLYKSITVKYDSIISSLTSDNVDVKLKDAIIAGIGNAKSGYGLNGKLFDSALTTGLRAEEILNYNNGGLSAQSNIYSNRIQPIYYDYAPSLNLTIGRNVDGTITSDIGAIKGGQGHAYQNAQLIANKMAEHIFQGALPNIGSMMTGGITNHGESNNDPFVGDDNIGGELGYDDRASQEMGHPEIPMGRLGNGLQREQVTFGKNADGFYRGSTDHESDMVPGKPKYDQIIDSISGVIYHGLTTPNGPLKNYGTYPFNVVSETNALVENTTSILENMNSKLNSATNLLTRINSQGLTGWGYDGGFNDYGNDLYLQFGKMDELYTGSALQTTYLALEELQQINEENDQLLDDYENLVLPQNIKVVKSSKDLDYEKIDVKLTKISNGQNIPIEISGYEDFSKIELPDGLSVGTYMLKVENKIVEQISQSQSYQQNSYLITLSNEVNNLIGGYVNGKYPIIKFTSLGNNRYRIWTGQFTEDLISVEEHYIDPVSIIVDVKVNYDKMIYDFFYGTFFDEYVETLENGNKVYYRQILGTNGNPIANYKIEMDYVNLQQNGMPVLHYQRYDTETSIDETIDQGNIN